VQGIPIAIAGPPNAGKSTLLNTLLNEERAIVTEIAGTTRDTVEDKLVRNGISYRLIDTAGIRETTDVVERIGIERSRQAIKKAVVVILMYEAATNQTEIMPLMEMVQSEDKALVLVRNKADLDQGGFWLEGSLEISAKSGSGLDALWKSVEVAAGVGEFRPDAMISQVRHVEALRGADEALSLTKAGLESELGTELVALDLRRALKELGRITGEIDQEEVLGSIFGRFCIGK